jgi:hypothetical protein
MRDLLALPDGDAPSACLVPRYIVGYRASNGTVGDKLGDFLEIQISIIWYRSPSGHNSADTPSAILSQIN